MFDIFVVVGGGGFFEQRKYKKNVYICCNFSSFSRNTSTSWFIIANVLSHFGFSKPNEYVIKTHLLLFSFLYKIIKCNVFNLLIEFYLL